MNDRICGNCKRFSQLNAFCSWKKVNKDRKDTCPKFDRLDEEKCGGCSKDCEEPCGDISDSIDGMYGWLINDDDDLSSFKSKEVSPTIYLHSGEPKWWVDLKHYSENRTIKVGRGDAPKPKFSFYNDFDSGSYKISFLRFSRPSIDYSKDPILKTNTRIVYKIKKRKF